MVRVQHAVTSPSRSPLRFFLLVFALAAPFYLIGVTGIQLSADLPVSALGFVVPVTAAAMLVYRESGAAGVAALLRRSLDYKRIRAKAWYVPVLLLPPGIQALTYEVMRWTGSPLPTGRTPSGSSRSPPRPAARRGRPSTPCSASRRSLASGRAGWRRGRPRGPHVTPRSGRCRARRGTPEPGGPTGGSRRPWSRRGRLPGGVARRSGRGDAWSRGHGPDRRAGTWCGDRSAKRRPDPSGGSIAVCAGQT
jgi:hypothetical protein